MNTLINDINHITTRLNNLTLGLSIKIKLRKRRQLLVKHVLSHPTFDKNKRYFILPLIKPNLYISYNTALVGNSSNLLNNHFGPSIDSHSDVVRFNYAITKNYKQFCGSKHTLHVCGSPALTGIKPINHPHIDNMEYQLHTILFNNNIIVFYKNNTNLNVLNKHKHKFIKNGNSFFTLPWIHQFFNDILHFHNIKPLKKHPQCGTGFMLLLVDLGICPDIYGIDTSFCNDNFHYYWDNVNDKCKQLSKWHDYNDEFRIPIELNKIKLTNIHS